MRIIGKNRSLLIIGLLITFLIVPACIVNGEKTREIAIVIKVVDGDSIEVRHQGKLMAVRLYGIDSPEWEQPFSTKAKLYLEKMVLGKYVEIEELYIDKFSRSVALMYYQGICVNQVLVEQGLAWVHIYYCHKKGCEYWKELERQARDEKIGLWQERRPIPPWVWKRKKR